MPKKPHHEIVAEKIIKKLEEGTAPWQLPFDKISDLPVNPTTGNRYKGINAIHLMNQDRDDPRWMTFKQAKSAGAYVQRNESGTSIQFWKFYDEKNKINKATGKVERDENNKIIKEKIKLQKPRVFYASVFNAEQIKGLPPLERKDHQWDSLEKVENILEGSGAIIKHDGKGKAFYRMSSDSIHLPKKERFDEPAKYYATALHELGHWTGHKSRLDRDMGGGFGSTSYAKEELRAEISSMLVGATLNIGHDPSQHVSYVKSWIKALKDDPKEIFRAASDAEKIHDFVIAYENVKSKQSKKDKVLTAEEQIKNEVNESPLSADQKKTVLKKIRQNLEKINENEIKEKIVEKNVSINKERIQER